MLDKFKSRDDRDRGSREARDLTDRDARIRERMRAEGIGEDEARRLILSEEELRVGTRQVQAGEVDIHKHVDTEHVREQVQLHHEEADVERRPIRDPMNARGSIGDDEEIRIPLSAEEVVVEKRVVPREELVVRKRDVVENKAVETDLRRERAEVEQRDVRRDDMRASPAEPRRDDARSTPSDRDMRRDSSRDDPLGR